MPFGRFGVETIAKISFVQDYTIVLQHWGIMVGLMGVSMIVAAYRKDWRDPILIYSGSTAVSRNHSWFIWWRRT